MHRRPLGKIRCRWDDIIYTNLIETRRVVVNWSDLARDREKWWALVNLIIYSRILIRWDFPAVLYRIIKCKKIRWVLFDCILLIFYNPVFHYPQSVVFLDYLLTLILRRSRTGTVWFYTSTSNKRAARPKLYTKSLTRDLKRMYSGLTLVRISIKL